MFNVLVVAAYVFSSALIVYSLLLFNLVQAARPAKQAQISRPATVLEAPVLGNLPNFKTVWYETIFFVDRVGGAMGNPLAETIDLYSRGLANLFLGVGNVLSQIPKILTSPPAFARSGSW